jgi:hypothetical protein
VTLLFEEKYQTHMGDKSKSRNAKIDRNRERFVIGREVSVVKRQGISPFECQFLNYLLTTRHRN